jgi:hypothetical protein
VITPIIVPVHKPTPKCPACREPERRKEVCAHCGYEYEQAPTDGRDVVLGIGLVALVLTVLFAGSLFLGPACWKLADKIECASPWYDDYTNKCEELPK